MHILEVQKLLNSIFFSRFRNRSNSLKLSTPSALPVESQYTAFKMPLRKYNFIVNNINQEPNIIKTKI